PLLAYRLYTLHTSQYLLERDRLFFRWGLRTEVIPMSEVLWVRTRADLPELRLPRLGWPGAILGYRRLPNGAQVEFLASQTRNLLVIATTQGLFAISPADVNALLHAYQRLNELGSLTPAASESVYPTFLLGRLWEMRPARYLLGSAALLSLGLVVWVSLAIPAHTELPLGYTAAGQPRSPIPAIRLTLLPVLNTIFLILNTFLGLFFFRRRTTWLLAYLLWGTSLVVAVLFLGAVFFILRIA
ncbi:MAG: hypothetical protein JW862_13985, partial [Anaerolineales bacterium]|nr:hypothetical protein [Anaerolineales bacterium]